MNSYLIWLLGYSVLLMAIGIYFSRRVQKASDFLVAGRGLSAGLIFSTFLAANIGAGSTVGAASLGYQMGWSAWWWVGSAGLGCLVLANIVGPKIWALAHEQNFNTLGDFLERRYSRSVRALSALILWAGSLVLLAAQIVAISIILNVVVGLPHWEGCWLGGFVVVVYFTAGGLLSSAWINVFELVILLAGFLLALPYAIHASGSWSEIVRRVTLNEATVNPSSYFSPLGLGPSGILYYVALLSPSFIVSPGLIQKCYGARSESAVRIGVNWNSFALFLFAAIPPCLGIIAASHFPALQDPQMALPKVLLELLPPWLGILALAAIFSAEISTCDAVLFMLSTSLTIDLYQTFLRPGASERVLLRVSRVTAAVAGFLSILVAIQLPSIVSALTVFYGLVSVSLFAPVIVGLYSDRPTSGAALAAILVSVASAIGIYAIWGMQFLGFLNPVLLGILISFMVLWTATGFQRSRSRST